MNWKITIRKVLQLADELFYLIIDPVLLRGLTTQASFAYLIIVYISVREILNTNLSVF